MSGKKKKLKEKSVGKLNLEDCVRNLQALCKDLGKSKNQSGRKELKEESAGKLNLEDCVRYLQAL